MCRSPCQLCHPKTKSLSCSSILGLEDGLRESVRMQMPRPTSVSSLASLGKGPGIGLIFFSPLLDKVSFCRMRTSSHS